MTSKTIIIMGFSWCGLRHDSEVHSGERLSQGAVTLTALCCRGFVSENNLDFKKKKKFKLK